MKRYLLLSLLLSGCAVVQIDTAVTACKNLAAAQQEADMAPAWYVSTGAVLAACGYPGAKADAEERACAADRRNGYACGGGDGT